MTSLNNAEKQEIIDLISDIFTEKEDDINLRHIQLIRRLAESSDKDAKKMIEGFSDDSITDLIKSSMSNLIMEQKDSTEQVWSFGIDPDDEVDHDNKKYLMIWYKTSEYSSCTESIELTKLQQELLLKDAVKEEVNGKYILDPEVVKKNYTENSDVIAKELIGDFREFLQGCFSEFIDDFEHGYTDEKILQLINEDEAELEELNEPQNATVMFSTRSNDLSTSEINQVVAEEDKAKIVCKV